MLHTTTALLQLKKLHSASLILFAAALVGGSIFGGGIGALIGSSFPRFERRF